MIKKTQTQFPYLSTQLNKINNNKMNICYTSDQKLQVLLSLMSNLSSKSTFSIHYLLDQLQQEKKKVDLKLGSNQCKQIVLNQRNNQESTKQNSQNFNNQPFQDFNSNLQLNVYQQYHFQKYIIPQLSNIFLTQIQHSSSESLQTSSNSKQSSLENEQFQELYQSKFQIPLQIVNQSIISISNIQQKLKKSRQCFSILQYLSKRKKSKIYNRYQKKKNYTNYLEQILNVKRLWLQKINKPENQYIQQKLQKNQFEKIQYYNHVQEKIRSLQLLIMKYQFIPYLFVTKTLQNKLFYLLSLRISLKLQTRLLNLNIQKCIQLSTKFINYYLLYNRDITQNNKSTQNKKVKQFLFQKLQQKSQHTITTLTSNLLNLIMYFKPDSFQNTQKQISDCINSTFQQNLLNRFVQVSLTNITKQITLQEFQKISSMMQFSQKSIKILYHWKKVWFQSYQAQLNQINSLMVSLFNNKQCNQMIVEQQNKNTFFKFKSRISKSRKDKTNTKNIKNTKGIKTIKRSQQKDDGNNIQDRFLDLQKYGNVKSIVQRLVVFFTCSVSKYSWISSHVMKKYQKQYFKQKACFFNITTQLFKFMTKKALQIYKTSQQRLQKGLIMKWLIKQNKKISSLNMQTQFWQIFSSQLPFINNNEITHNKSIQFRLKEQNQDTGIIRSMLSIIQTHSKLQQSYKNNKKGFQDQISKYLLGFSQFQIQSIQKLNKKQNQTQLLRNLYTINFNLNQSQINQSQTIDGQYINLQDQQFLLSILKLLIHQILLKGNYNAKKDQLKRYAQDNYKYFDSLYDNAQKMSKQISQRQIDIEKVNQLLFNKKIQNFNLNKLICCDYKKQTSQHRNCQQINLYLQRLEQLSYQVICDKQLNLNLQCSAQTNGKYNKKRLQQQQDDEQQPQYHEVRLLIKKIIQSLMSVLKQKQVQINDQQRNQQKEQQNQKLSSSSSKQSTQGTKYNNLYSHNIQQILELKYIIVKLSILIKVYQKVLLENIDILSLKYQLLSLLKFTKLKSYFRQNSFNNQQKFQFTQIQSINQQEYHKNQSQTNYKSLEIIQNHSLYQNKSNHYKSLDILTDLSSKISQQSLSIYQKSYNHLQKSQYLKKQYSDNQKDINEVNQINKQQSPPYKKSKLSSFVGAIFGKSKKQYSKKQKTIKQKK